MFLWELKPKLYGWVSFQRAKEKEMRLWTTHPLDIQIENSGIMSLRCWIPQHYLSCKLQSLQSQYASLNLQCCNKPFGYLTVFYHI
jgi:hypothetical protein